MVEASFPRPFQADFVLLPPPPPPFLVGLTGLSLPGIQLIDGLLLFSFQVRSICRAQCMF